MLMLINIGVNVEIDVAINCIVSAKTGVEDSGIDMHLLRGKDDKWSKNERKKKKKKRNEREKKNKVCGKGSGKGIWLQVVQVREEKQV